jgi:methylmalonyl-CoA mutase cobalamin-binding domain/chain
MEGDMGRDQFQELLLAIQKADRAGAMAVISDWAVGRSFARVMPELLSPVLETFGEIWATGQGGVSLATGYVASKIAEDVLSRILQEAGTRGAPGPAKGPVVLGNAEDDFHPLGRKMVAGFLRADGWDVRDLGVDVSPERFLDEAEETGAKVIGVSAMMHTTARNVARVREEIDRRGRTGRIQLAVGGAVFRLRPELVADFGADGSTPSAVGASDLFLDLWRRAAELGATARGTSP